MRKSLLIVFFVIAFYGVSFAQREVVIQRNADKTLTKYVVEQSQINEEQVNYEIQKNNESIEVDNAKIDALLIDIDNYKQKNDELMALIEQPSFESIATVKGVNWEDVDVLVYRQVKDLCIDGEVLSTDCAKYIQEEKDLLEAQEKESRTTYQYQYITIVQKQPEQDVIVKTSIVEE